jgi:hypothetical protein
MTPRFTTAHPPADSRSRDEEIHRLPARLAVTIASQNTRGVPLWGSDLAGRYARIGSCQVKLRRLLDWLVLVCGLVDPRHVW